MKAASLVLALLCLATGTATAATKKAKDAKPDIPVEDKTLVLEPMKINGRPPISYAFDLGLYLTPGTKTVSRIFIIRVEENSDVERAGLQVGDEIVKLEGLPVKGMEARVAPASPLGRIFINRTPGAPLELEVIVRRTQKLTLHAQNFLRLERQP